MPQRLGLGARRGAGEAVAGSIIHDQSGRSTIGTDLVMLIVVGVAHRNRPCPDQNVASYAHCSNLSFAVGKAKIQGLHPLMEHGI